MFYNVVLNLMTHSVHTLGHGVWATLTQKTHRWLQIPDTCVLGVGTSTEPTSRTLQLVSPLLPLTLLEV